MAISARRRARAERESGGILHFFRETVNELRKVVWPTPQELYRYTLVVIVTVAVIAGFIFAVDTGLHELARRFIYVGKTG
jgi:preprotein translocase subunit SecE